MAIGAIIGAAKKVASKVGKKALSEGKQLVSPSSGDMAGGGDDDFMGPGAGFVDFGRKAYKDVSGGNPLHYQTHVNDAKKNRQGSKKGITLHHKGE